MFPLNTRFFFEEVQINKKQNKTTLVMNKMPSEDNERLPRSQKKTD